MHAYTVNSDERDSVSVVSLRTPMPLAFSGKPSAIGAPSCCCPCSSTPNAVP